MIFRNWVLENFPFIEDDFDALTDYELFSKVVGYMRESLEKVNAFQKDIDIFTAKLNEFEHYFDNLDVTEEVNAKLDEMVEDGTMTELIAEYLQLQTTYTYDTVADLKLADNLVNGMFARTSGYASYNDGSGAYYKIRSVTVDDTVDDGFIVGLADNTLVAELIIDGDLKISTLGIGDNATTNTTILQSALAYIQDNHHDKQLVIDKSFSVNTIDFTDVNSVMMVGKNRQTGITVIGADNVGITLNTNLNSFKNLRFKTSNNITLFNITGKYNRFENVSIYGGNSDTARGVYINNVWSNSFVNCDIREFKENVYLDNTCNYTLFDNCVIIASDTSSGNNIYVAGGANIVFSKCEIEKGNANIYINGGIVNIDSCYIEGASGSYAIKLLGGQTNFTNNFFSNSKIAKYTDNQLTLSHNIVKKTNASDYLLYPLESNIGYLVIDNNMLVGDTGYITNVDSANNPLACVRYFNGSVWAQATKDNYMYVNQNNIYTVSPAGRNYVYIKENEFLKGGPTSTLPTINDLMPAGITYGDRNVNKLLFLNKNVNKWYDSLGNTPVAKRSSIPGSGTYAVGDIVWNSTPSAGGNIGWVCVTAGTPGTWKSFGSISS